ncbi:putative zinc transporter [Tieghemostelium lacteum]|uniref:Putative zinc transporter n=1 Tax=Tieghemostelium lacteum TaxID=361077 RepID=A0A151ZA69_TIELA|nr:putative zinc transporter [Tieghemostelium lacteum]|eukprot:KYQ90837.1 putative zinc transporter [Tieghemostelium lacteum]
MDNNTIHYGDQEDYDDHDDNSKLVSVDQEELGTTSNNNINNNNNNNIILNNNDNHEHDNDRSVLQEIEDALALVEEGGSSKDKKHKHGHSHSGKEKKSKKDKEHGHSHGHNAYDHSEHGHSHSHSDHSDDEKHMLSGSGKKGFFNMDKKKKARVSLLLALCLTTIFMVGEVVGGYLANSLAIMTDAAHLLTDIGAMCLSLFAMWIANHPPTGSMSFGFHRAEILGALVSVLMIWALTGVLVYEGIQRVMHPPEVVDGKIMFIIACGGLLINVIDAIILHWGSGGHGHSHGLGGGGGHSHGPSKKKKSSTFTDRDIENLDGHEPKREIENINVHSAYIHVLGDCLQSIGVMIASVLIWIKPSWKIADPITTFIFSVIVLLTTIKLLRQSLGVLMEAVPQEIDSYQVQSDLFDLEGVEEVHDLHIWSITVGKPALSVHLSIREGIDPDQILQNANRLLAEYHSITHTTIQIEKPKGDSQCRDNSCPPPTTRSRILGGPIVPEH